MVATDDISFFLRSKCRCLILFDLLVFYIFLPAACSDTCCIGNTTHSLSSNEGLEQFGIKLNGKHKLAFKLIRESHV